MAKIMQILLDLLKLESLHGSSGAAKTLDRILLFLHVDDWSKMNRFGPSGCTICRANTLVFMYIVNLVASAPYCICRRPSCCMYCQHRKLSVLNPVVCIKGMTIHYSAVNMVLYYALKGHCMNMENSAH